MNDENKPVKKVTKRSKAKYPALHKQYNLKIRANEIDYDYINRLSDFEKEWLNKFTEEYTNASVPKDPEVKAKMLHNTPALQKSCRDHNNARNRCIMSLQEANYGLDSLTDLEQLETDETEMDEMITDLDSKLVDDPTDS